MMILLASALSLFAAGPSDDEGIPTSLSIEEPSSRERAASASMVWRSLGGRVQVRENAVQGTTLHLGSDLGYGSQLGGRADFRYGSPTQESLFEVEYLDGAASHTASRDFAYNGAFYTAGENLRTLTHSLTVRIHQAWKTFGDPEHRWWTGPLLGIEYPYYLVNLTTPAIPHNTEDWIHYYPYPVVGWAGRATVAEGLRVEGRTTIGYFPNLPSAYIEGGRLYVSVRPSVWVDLGLAWTVSPVVRLRAGFEYQYWYGGDHSNEDGNKLRFSSPGARLGIEFAW
jgi:hypothetical protein